MKIRKLIESDLETLSKLYKEFWNEESNIEYMRNKFLELINNPKYIFLCAEIDNKLVGSIMGIVCEELYGECTPFLLIEDLVVDKKFRRNRIGQALMNELEIIGKNNHCSQVQFITEISRKDTILFYESLGYNSKTHIGFKKKF